MTNTQDLAEKVIKSFAAKGLMIATAESCTGGLIAASLTGISGSSAVVDRGFVTYSNDAKMEMLGVLEVTLKTHGAVSDKTALEMAQGALGNSDADIAVAVTGIAGPGGGTPEKPVGLVYLAIATDKHVNVHKLMFGELKNRDEIRQATVERALTELVSILNE
ncbi:CinA family protein [Lentilitoribacter sp. Alg239-R112]|jgi:nicotinamide-nucleotide amidase|uniref:CinA family protein n=1 Tax=Lentilitoribacter sp. Alg239-R112 TaxID=2305987 RepID=UPI0013A6D0AE|nr:CinA family protein [Lentilitoribacter sp. Alg239-R112]